MATSSSSSSSEVFAQTARFKETVALVNGAAADRFGQFVARLLSSSSSSSSSGGGDAFSAAERARLPAALSLQEEGAAAVDALVEGCVYILEQAAYHALSPGALAEQLRAAGVGDAHAAALADAWRLGAAPLLERLRGASVAPLALAGVDWRLHVRLARQMPRERRAALQAQYAAAQQQSPDAPPPPAAEVVNAPTALFQFDLRGDDDDDEGDDGATTAVLAELTKPELQAFYAKLERIQDQLDRLI